MSKLLESFELTISHDDLCQAVKFWLNSVVLQSSSEVATVTNDKTANTFTIELYHVDSDES